MKYASVFGFCYLDGGELYLFTSSAEFNRNSSHCLDYVSDPADAMVIFRHSIQYDEKSKNSILGLVSIYTTYFYFVNFLSISGVYQWWRWESNLPQNKNCGAIFSVNGFYLSPTLNGKDRHHWSPWPILWFTMLSKSLFSCLIHWEICNKAWSWYYSTIWVKSMLHRCLAIVGCMNGPTTSMVLYPGQHTLDSLLIGQPTWWYCPASISLVIHVQLSTDSFNKSLQKFRTLLSMVSCHILCRFSILLLDRVIMDRYSEECTKATFHVRLRNYAIVIPTASNRIKNWNRNLKSCLSLTMSRSSNCLEDVGHFGMRNTLVCTSRSFV